MVAVQDPDTAGIGGESTNARRIRIDLHIHTCYSGDCLSRLEDLSATALDKRLNALAVTDHNAIDGALALQALAPFPVIVGEEIGTCEGEVIGLFLKELIPRGLTLAESVRRVRAQGGLVYVPHPFDRHRPSALGEARLLSILDQVDAIEVLNARAIEPADNEKARLFAQTHGIPGGAGSDGHTLLEIGQAYVEMEPFTDKDSFLRSLEGGQVCGSVSGPYVHLFSTWAKIAKRGGNWLG